MGVLWLFLPLHPLYPLLLHSRKVAGSGVLVGGALPAAPSLARRPGGWGRAGSEAAWLSSPFLSTHLDWLPGLARSTVGPLPSLPKKASEGCGSPQLTLDIARLGQCGWTWALSQGIPAF